jgi:hypothetical protein
MLIGACQGRVCPGLHSAALAAAWPMMPRISLSRLRGLTYTRLPGTFGRGRQQELFTRMAVLTAGMEREGPPSPVSEGGPGRQARAILACRQCHSERSPLQFRGRIVCLISAA